MNSQTLIFSLIEIGISILLGVLILYLSYKLIDKLIKDKFKIKNDNISYSIFVSSVLFSVAYLISGIKSPILNSIKLLLDKRALYNADDVPIIFDLLRKFPDTLKGYLERMYIFFNNSLTIFFGNGGPININKMKDCMEQVYLLKLLNSSAEISFNMRLYLELGGKVLEPKIEVNCIKSFTILSNINIYVKDLPQEDKNILSIITEEQYNELGDETKEEFEDLTSSFVGVPIFEETSTAPLSHEYYIRGKLTTAGLMQIGKSTVNSTIKTNDFYKIGYNDELLVKKLNLLKEQDINFPEDFVERYKDLREKCNVEILASNNQMVRLAVEQYLVHIFSLYCGREDHEMKIKIAQLPSKAADDGHQEVTEFLKKPLLEEGLPSKALMMASRQGHDEVVALLLANGADVNKPRNDGVTPLMLAASGGKEKVVKLLLENKANVDKCSQDKSTSLMYAVKSDSKEIVTLLLKNGATRNIKNSHEKQAIDYAKSKDIKELLSQKASVPTNYSPNSNEVKCSR